MQTFLSPLFLFTKCHLKSSVLQIFFKPVCHFFQPPHPVTRFAASAEFVIFPPEHAEPRINTVIFQRGKHLQALCKPAAVVFIRMNEQGWGNRLVGILYWRMKPHFLHIVPWGGLNLIRIEIVSDIGYYFNADQIQSTPWDNVEKMWFHSPVKYADQAVTPTLFIHSNEDYRCWLAEGLQMFTALKYHGVDARLCMFRGENHELSRSGKPRHRVRRLEEMTNWFEKYLKD